ncbi:contact-dependent growth inhibition system immunity protein [Paenibacillus sp. SI8]|uniref:contact-dependent growth inhibition system immunity protein n=1 Tax=unclassified Paenibacillus TaxID=185978 RepID=UPI003467C787
MIDRGLTISAIRKIEGLTFHVKTIESAPLSEWYQSILDFSLEKLPDGDLARLIRQKKHLNFVLWEALIRISNNPIVGELYDGEVINSLNKVTSEYWNDNIRLLDDFLVTLSRAYIARKENSFTFNEKIDEEEYYSMLDVTISYLQEIRNRN